MVREDNRIREERVKRAHSMRVGSGGGGGGVSKIQRPPPPPPISFPTKVNLASRICLFI